MNSKKRNNNKYLNKKKKNKIFIIKIKFKNQKIKFLI